MGLFPLLAVRLSVMDKEGRSPPARFLVMATLGK